MNLLSNQYADIDFKEHLDYVKITWKKSAPHDKHQAIVNQCLQALELLDCHKLLSDVRKIGVVKAWIEQEWLKDAKSKGLDEIALLVKEQTYKGILTKRSSCVEQKSGGITNHMFRNEIIAERWLLSAS